MQHKVVFVFILYWIKGVKNQFLSIFRKYYSFFLIYFLDLLLIVLLIVNFKIIIAKTNILNNIIIF